MQEQTDAQSWELSSADETANHLASQTGTREFKNKGVEGGVGLVVLLMLVSTKDPVLS